MISPIPTSTARTPTRTASPTAPSSLTRWAADATKSTGEHATSPLDPKDHPSYLSRLRLEKIDVRPFHILFVGVVNLGGKNLFQIALQDVSSSAQPPLKHTGDALDYEGWIVGTYTPKTVVVEDPGTHAKVSQDQSTLELDKPSIGASVLLPLRQTINAPEATAYFVTLIPSEVGKEIKVDTGKNFNFSLGTPTDFLVISAKDTGAVIRNIKDNTETTVPKLNPADWNDVPVPPVDPNAAKSAN